jgi:hypothetical protein
VRLTAGWWTDSRRREASRFAVTRVLPASGDLAIIEAATG